MNERAHRVATDRAEEEAQAALDRGAVDRIVAKRTSLRTQMQPAAPGSLLMHRLAAAFSDQGSRPAECAGAPPPRRPRPRSERLGEATRSRSAMLVVPTRCIMEREAARCARIGAPKTKTTVAEILEKFDEQRRRPEKGGELGVKA